MKYRPWVRWGVTLAGLGFTVAGAAKVWQDDRFLRELVGLPEPGVQAVMKFSLAMDAAGTVVFIGLTIWAFLGLKNWANKPS